MKLGDTPAFPESHASPYRDPDSGEWYSGWQGCAGMTLRQYAAIKAMQGLLASEVSFKGHQELAEHSILCADALLKELEK